MLNLKSSPKDIVYYISQINSLSLSEKENLLINKILSLEEIICDEDTKSLISTDLKDSSWISETQQLVEICRARKEKTKLITKHASECISFLIYRVLEIKLTSQENLIYDKLAKTFKDTQNVEWKNNYLKDFLMKSKIPSVLNKSNTDSSISIDLKFIHQNRNNFFSNSLFKSIKY